MKISLNWLKTYVDCTQDATEVAALLTQSGLEVAHVTPTVRGNLEGLVLGEVLSCEPHPNADRLKTTSIHVGQERPLTIVCGAPNVAAGQKVVVAPAGSVLYPYPDGAPWPIGKNKIRGVASEGMLCSAKELGLGSEDTGILVLSTDLPAGTAAKVYFKDALDAILEVEITPNRADACSHLGIARELKALLHLPIACPSVEAFASDAFPSPLQLGKLDTELCPNYCGVFLQNVAATPSPAWLRTRLERIGVKPINLLVDVTNFVLHDVGQPLHAFDFDQIKGDKLSVQKVAKGTLFVGLDGIERTLTGQETMICDAAGPIAMAGILGSLRTCIREDTKRIFVESAYFTPKAVRIAAQAHRLKTEASFRFERGTDPTIPLYALKRAVLLLKECMPNALVSEIATCQPTRIDPVGIPLRYERINQLLGMTLDPLRVKQLLLDLEVELESETETGCVARVPPYRVDVAREVDLIEEIARLYGYDAVPTQKGLAVAYVAPKTEAGEAHGIEQAIAELLAGKGCAEIWTNSLTKSAYNQMFPTTDVDGWQPIALLNPLSSAADALRHTLLFSGLEVIAYNAARGKKNELFFEFGTIYGEQHGATAETKQLALWLTGEVETCGWTRQSSAVGWAHVRHILEQVAAKLGIECLAYAPVTHPHYERAAQATGRGLRMATFGSVDRSILQHLGIEQPVFAAEIHWQEWLKARKTSTTYAPISKFPVVKRDLALVLDQSVSFQSIRDLVRKQKSTIIRSMHLIDVYQGKPLPIGKKSYAIRFALQDQEHTLEEKSIDQLMQQLMRVFERELHAIIRR